MHCPHLRFKHKKDKTGISSNQFNRLQHFGQRDRSVTNDSRFGKRIPTTTKKEPNTKPHKATNKNATISTIPSPYFF
ncbi:hypothetical protein J32TS6_40210 [Virgibacillus pantothenticus]|nr:hypothetical protein J32TS6_40210 [Virgibacillus pantothenticus]